MSRRICFVEVGRDSKSWDVDWSEIRRDDIESDGLPSPDWIAAKAKQGGGLASRDVDVIQRGDDERDFSVVVGGFRVVGRGRIEGEPMVRAEAPR